MRMVWERLQHVHQYSTDQNTIWKSGIGTAITINCADNSGTWNICHIPEDIIVNRCYSMKNTKPSPTCSTVVWVVISSATPYTSLHVTQEYLIVWTVCYQKPTTMEVEVTQYMSMEMGSSCWEEPNWKEVWFQRGQLGSICYEVSFLIITSVTALGPRKFTSIIF